MEFTVKRSKRKTCEIQITEEGGILVKVPLTYSDVMVQRLIDKKMDWIEKAQQQVRLVTPKPQYLFGSKLSILGDEYTVLSHEGKKFTIDEEKHVIFCPVLETEISSERQAAFNYRGIEMVLKVFLLTYLKERADDYANDLGVSYQDLRVKKIKSRWGSCSSKKNLNFALNLVLAPKPIVDYVVAHEVAHLREMNHSCNFWTLVEKIHPTFSEDRKWLKTNALSLKF